MATDTRTVLRNSRTHLTQRIAASLDAETLVALAKIAIPENAPIRQTPKRRTKITK